ncbi:hypothetical protein [Chryseobacterium sp. KMC2]|nr:hypothetical protein [Chryseobacterium sp. KMC2]
MYRLLGWDQILHRLRYGHHPPKTDVVSNNDHILSKVVSSDFLY